MAGKKMTPREKRVQRLNKLLMLLCQQKGNRLEIKEIAKRMKMSGAAVSAALRTLKDMGRISDNQIVVNPKDIAMDEYANFSYPFGSGKKAKKAKKAARIVKGSKKKPVHRARPATAKEIRESLGLRAEPDFMWGEQGMGKTFPIREEEPENPAGETVTITGTPGALASFFRQLK